MYTAKIENKTGEVLTLTGDEAVYQVTNITGLNPPSAQINTSSAVGLDGTLFNSAKLNTRNLVLTIKINGDVETNRLNLYSYFQTKEWCKFYYTNDSLDVSIEGYIETVECNLFSNNEMAQISIICLYPYFKGLTENRVKFSDSVGLFTFPFFIDIGEPIPFSNYNVSGNIEVYNASENETGMTIEITVNKPVNSIKLMDVGNGDTFILNYSFVANDNIIINTMRGQKSITLLRSNNTINLFSALQSGSTFFQLNPGVNTFLYYANNVANSGRISVLFRYFNIYRGV